MWRVAVGGQDHVYCVDGNHRKERLVAIGRGGTPEDLFSRPALLLTGTPPVHPAPPPPPRCTRMHGVWLCYLEDTFIFLGGWWLSPLPPPPPPERCLGAPSPSFETVW